MQVEFTADAQIVEDRLYVAAGHAYERLWDVLDRIVDDAEEAKHSNWTNYVSTFDLWGSKVPGTDYTVFWRVSAGLTLTVALIAREEVA